MDGAEGAEGAGFGGDADGGLADVEEAGGAIEEGVGFGEEVHAEDAVDGAAVAVAEVFADGAEVGDGDLEFGDEEASEAKVLNPRD